jgi:hypothetical protein
VVVFSLNSSRYGELAAQLGGLVIADPAPWTFQSRTRSYRRVEPVR